METSDQQWCVLCLCYRQSIANRVVVQKLLFGAHEFLKDEKQEGLHNAKSCSAAHELVKVVWPKTSSNLGASKEWRKR